MKIAPPVLMPPGPRKKRVLDLLWWVMLALTLTAIAGGVWRGVVEHRVVTPAFARLGLKAYVEPSECYKIAPRFSDFPEIGRIPHGGGCLIAVGDTPAEEFATLEEVARRIDGPADGSVTLVVSGRDGTPVRLVLESDDRLAASIHQFAQVRLFFVEIAGHTFAGLLFAFAAVLLRQKRPEDPVSLRLSLAFVALPNIGTGAELFWQWLGPSSAPAFAIIIAVWILIVTLPAFPDGRYVPRATRWLALAPPLMLFGPIILESSFGGEGALHWLVTAGVMIIVITGPALLVLRYLKMPAGLERQQLKWAAFGFTAGLLLLIISGGFTRDPADLTSVSPEAEFSLLAIHLALLVAGLALMPAGIVISLMQYRLNDADAAIGKSLGYVVVTLIVGVAWAVASQIVNRYVGRISSEPMVVTGLSAVLAALVFAPARTLVLSWTEAKFQRALVRLRALPGKLLRWQSSETPEELAEAALVDIVDGVGAAYGAILGDNGRAWRVLAANGIEPDSAMEQLALERPAERRDDPFPIRVTLVDEMGEPDLLAIGPRSDGASYTKDERSAIASIVEPLSAAIQACARRERHIAAIAGSLTAIEQRLARIEGQGPAAGQASVRERPARRSSSHRESP